MEALTPFAQMPTTPEPIIAQVRRLLADDARYGETVPTTILDRVADHAVRELWGSPVKTFIPILALRQAREVLREQEVVSTGEHREMRRARRAPTVGRPRIERPGDDLSVDGDVLPIDERDVHPL